MKHTCPLRLDEDIWQRRTDADRWTRKGVCSHCGCTKPERIAAMLHAGLDVVIDEGSADACIYDPAGRLAGRVVFPHITEDLRRSVETAVQATLAINGLSLWY